MRTFEILLNDRKLCAAGVGESGVLTAIVSWTRQRANVERASSRRAKEELKLDVGGLVHSTAEHLQWQNRRLRVGDEIRIRIGESERATKPSRRERSDPARDQRAKKRFVETAAKEFGWTISKAKRR